MNAEVQLDILESYLKVRKQMFQISQKLIYDRYIEYGNSI